MISIKELRQDPDSFKDRLALKGEPIDLKSILSADRALRALKTQVNDLRADRNNASEFIGLAKKFPSILLYQFWCIIDALPILGLHRLERCSYTLSSISY